MLRYSIYCKTCNTLKTRMLVIIVLFDIFSRKKQIPITNSLGEISSLCSKKIELTLESVPLNRLVGKLRIELRIFLKGVKN